MPFTDNISVFLLFALLLIIVNEGRGGQTKISGRLLFQPVR
jgi:hypothetical protein